MPRRSAPASRNSRPASVSGMPVYVLFTKADLIAGFTEFFDDLDRERRDQVWGATFPLQAGEPVPGPIRRRVPAPWSTGSTTACSTACRTSEPRAARPDRRFSGADRQPRATADGASSRRPSAAPRSTGRPCCAASISPRGTQEGTPIDRLTGVMSRAFGLDQRRAASAAAAAGPQLFPRTSSSPDVIFGEAMLVSEPPAARARGRASCALRMPPLVC